MILLFESRAFNDPVEQRVSVRKYPKLTPKCNNRFDVAVKWQPTCYISASSSPASNPIPFCDEREIGIQIDFWWFDRLWPIR